VTFIDKKQPGTKDQETAENQLFNLDPEEVTGLEITNVHDTFIFQKNNNHWEIKKPVDTLADTATVEGILDQIAGAQPRQIIEPDKFTDANLKEWGLAPNAAERVVIHTKDKQYELLIGRKVAINDSVYARASGRKNEAVRVIPSTVKEALQKDLSDFRSRNVFDFEPNKVTKVATRVADTTATPGQQCEVDFKDGKWTLQMPLVARASDADVQALLGKILATHAIDFITDDASNLTQYGLTSPTATLSVTIQPDASDAKQPEEEMVLQIGGPVPNKPDQVYAQRLKSNSVFTLARSNVDDLLKAMPNVRDRHVFPFNPGTATGFSYSFGTRKAQGHRDQGLWKTTGDAEGSADVGKVNDLLARLSQLETTPLVKDSATDLKPFGLDKPQGKITIQSTEFKPEPSLSLLIGKAENKLLYVRNSAEPFIYTIPDNALDFLAPNNLSLLDARVINLDLNHVTGMTIITASVPPVPPVALARNGGGTWSATNVKDRMVDSLMADRQASLFCQLQAKTWLGPVLPAYALDKPVLTLAVQTDQPASSTVLRIGAALPDGSRAAQVEGQATAFELAEPDYDLLNSSSLQLIPQALSATNAPPAAPASNAPPIAPEKK
jgi:hypothetical protein